MELPLDNGGTLQVTSHVASECNPPPGEEEGSFQDLQNLNRESSYGFIYCVFYMVLSENHRYNRGAIF